jgi:glycosyltransferase involved in cell wall biosynthesis
MPPPLRILHVAADLDPTNGGVTPACLGAARLMAARGHEVTIAASDRGQPRHDAGAVRLEILPTSWPAALQISWPLRRRLRALIPAADVVHLHSLYLFHDFVAPGLCRRCGVPYIVWPHGALDPYIWRRHRGRKRVAEALFQNRVLRHAAGLHYTAAEEAELARPAAHNPRGVVLPVGVDLAQFSDLPPRTAFRERHPAIGERRIVLFLGRLNFKKGLDILVKAFATIAPRFADAVLVIAGPDDGMRAALEALVAAAGLGDRCFFLGMVTGEEKRMVLGASDIFALPSWSENFGIAVVEAAACGIPVVISRHVNLWREFAAAEACLAGPPEMAAVAAALAQLLADPQGAAAMGARGAALVRRRFVWEALGEDYERMYRIAARDRALPVLFPQC